MSRLSSSCNVRKKWFFVSKQLVRMFSWDHRVFEHMWSVIRDTGSFIPYTRHGFLHTRHGPIPTCRDSPNRIQQIPAQAKKMDLPVLKAFLQAVLETVGSSSDQVWSQTPKRLSLGGCILSQCVLSSSATKDSLALFATNDTEGKCTAASLASKYVWSDLSLPYVSRD
jgi:hypothetical protein